MFKKGHTETKEVKERRADTLREYYKNRPKLRARMSVNMMGKNNPMKNPKIASKCGRMNKGRVSGDETKKKITNSLKKLWNDDNYKQLMSDAHKGNKQTEETKKKIGKTSKERWKDSEYRKRAIKSMKDYLKDIDHKEKRVRILFKALKIKPNKTEIKLRDLLDEHHPEEWKFVGDGQFWLGGKNPDFMNVNGKKQIIELFGDYWHRGEDPQDRINHFSNFGFNTLVIWERELENMEKVRERIEDFSR